ncbi:GcrA family cell cycle regulator [Mesorhizobium sp. M0130]|uniref:GcrA family cell cycle regulator n=1 Tax=Mesorhizobium sp. M0130 TaxID=2956887 RepID=UPI00333DD9F7
MTNNGSGYSATEITAIAGWLRDGDSASRIAVRLSELRRESVSRNAIVGIVHRNNELKAIGFARAAGGSRPPLHKRKKQAALLKAVPHSPLARKAEQRAVGHTAYLPRKLFVQSVGETSPDPACLRLYAEAPAPRPRPVISPRKYDAGSRHLPLAELGANQCRFAVNDAPAGELHLFCGEVTGEGASYCAHHSARVYAGFSARAA